MFDVIIIKICSNTFSCPSIREYNSQRKGKCSLAFELYCWTHMKIVGTSK